MTASKIVAAAASGVGGAGLDVDEVFSTFLYEGESSAQTINNGIDLSGEGGLVWGKKRSASYQHNLFDTARGVNKSLSSNTSGAEATETGVTAFNSNGFTLGTWGGLNDNGEDFVSWTFRKAEKFFDVVTYTGDSGSDKAISHNLGSVPGMIIVKRRNASEDWGVWHRDIHAGSTRVMYLNSTGGITTSNSLYGSNPTSTHFYVGNHPVSNNENDTYVAYLFAHNDGDGVFGPNGDADIIKCGSYTGNGNTDGPTVNLGFEPQWLLIKGGINDNWSMFDVMRGIHYRSTSNQDPQLISNTTDVEATGDRLRIEPTGFKLTHSAGDTNGSGDTHIYMAIRRGPLAAPENGTDVFHPRYQTSGYGNEFTTNFPVDLALTAKTGGSTANALVGTRMLSDNKYLQTNVNNALENSNNIWNFDGPSTKFTQQFSTGAANVTWCWRRAHSYFDIVAYDGTSSAQNITHNLGVVPEMMWVKSTSNANSWTVFHKDQGATKRAFLSGSQAFDTGSTIWNNTAPTATQFTVGTDSNTNSNGHEFIAYLFATASGVSKVGSYTGTGQSGGDITVDCGFSSGARFVLIKRTDASGSWWVADTARGIVDGHDNLIELNGQGAQITNYNMVEPSSSGFIVNGSGGNSDNSWNDSGGNYIFYAIA